MTVRVDTKAVQGYYKMQFDIAGDRIRGSVDILKSFIRLVAQKDNNKDGIDAFIGATINNLSLLELAIEKIGDGRSLIITSINQILLKAEPSKADDPLTIVMSLTGTVIHYFTAFIARMSLKSEQHHKRALVYLWRTTSALHNLFDTCLTNVDRFIAVSQKYLRSDRFLSECTIDGEIPLKRIHLTGDPNECSKLWNSWINSPINRIPVKSTVLTKRSCKNTAMRNIEAPEEAIFDDDEEAFEEFEPILEDDEDSYQGELSETSSTASTMETDSDIDSGSDSDTESEAETRTESKTE